MVRRGPSSCPGGRALAGAAERCRPGPSRVQRRAATALPVPKMTERRRCTGAFQVRVFSRCDPGETLRSEPGRGPAAVTVLRLGGSCPGSCDTAAQASQACQWFGRALN